MKNLFLKKLSLILGITFLPLIGSEIFSPKIIRAQNVTEQLNLNPRLNFNSEVRLNADQQVNLGDQAFQNGDIPQAITYWAEALRLYESIPDPMGIGKVASYLAPVYLQLGDFPAAENAMRKHLAVARSRQDQLTMIRALNNLGTLLLERRGNFLEVEALFTEALETARSVGDFAGQGLSLSNLGRLAHAQGNYVEAIDLYKLAVRYRLQGNDILGQVNTLNNLADSYQMTQQYWESIFNYRLAQVTADSLGDLPNQYRAWEGLAKSYAALGYHRSAFRFLNQWGNMAIANNDLREQLNATSLSAYFYWQLKDRENAVTFYQQAINLATILGAQEELAFLKTELSKALYGNPYSRN